MKKTIEQYSVHFLITVSFLLIISCVTKRTAAAEETTTDTKIGEKYTVTVPIIYQNFINKKGVENPDHKELYIDYSGQKYFIKFCESNVNQKSLENYLSTINSSPKVVTLEISILKGLWICDKSINYSDNLTDGINMPQSRMGNYAIVHKIVMDKE